MAKLNVSPMPIFITSPTTKKTAPVVMATAAIFLTNRSMSRLSWLARFSSPTVSVAICPSKEPSPTRMTIPKPSPETTIVPLKASALDSSGFSSLLITARSCASDSPVIEELSTYAYRSGTTFSSLTCTRRRSAGTLSPLFRKTRSPTTSSLATTGCRRPSLMTIVCDGAMFRNESKMAADLYS